MDFKRKTNNVNVTTPRRINPTDFFFFSEIERSGSTGRGTLETLGRFSVISSISLSTMLFHPIVKWLLQTKHLLRDYYPVKLSVYLHETQHIPDDFSLKR